MKLPKIFFTEFGGKSFGNFLSVGCTLRSSCCVSASVASMRSFDVAGHLKGAILCQEEMQSYAFIQFFMCSITLSNHVFSATILFFVKLKCFTFIALQT